MYDVLIVGGGVIGLSLAWDLARHGQSVRLIDRGQPGREASWAGAGILPPARCAAADHPYEQLCGLSAELHPQWATALTALTDIDTGYRRSGGLYLARTPGEAAALSAWTADLAAQGIAVERVACEDLPRIEPGLAVPAQPLKRDSRYSAILAFLIPDEAQIRNPRHLRALIAACALAGVEITTNLTAAEPVLKGERVKGIATSAGLVAAERFCFTAGAWTGQLLASLGLPIAVLPVRGQMALFRCQQAPIRHILNEGTRYIVPRDDGHVLAGSTEEEVGFDKRTTEAAIADLAAFARNLVPQLAHAPIEQTWAGLRPATFDGLPYLGALPGLTNAFVAAGHFRSGLFLSPATAVVMSQLIRGEQPEIDLAPFRVGR